MVFLLEPLELVNSGQLIWTVWFHWKKCSRLEGSSCVIIPPGPEKVLSVSQRKLSDTGMVVYIDTRVAFTSTHIENWSRTDRFQFKKTSRIKGSLFWHNARCTGTCFSFIFICSLPQVWVQAPTPTPLRTSTWSGSTTMGLRFGTPGTSGSAWSYSSRPSSATFPTTSGRLPREENSAWLLKVSQARFLIPVKDTD